jgi:hypothetical protein
MPITLDGTNGITQAGEFNSDSSFGFKNRIINGAMVIDQRNAGASITSATNGSFSVDRWGVQNNSGASRFTLQQDAGAVTPPAGFSDYLGITSTSAYSVASGDACGIYQNIEGFNSIADLNWGTANAKTVTLSFWVRSSLTGTFGGALQNSGGSRTYPFSYTISAANTWEYKTITIAGETTGTWLATNGIGIVVMFGLGVGSSLSGTAGAWSTSNFFSATGATSVVGTNGATFYLTGVQLEVGSTATSFDYRPYGTELQLCQRYLPCFNPTQTLGTNDSVGAGFFVTSSTIRFVFAYQVPSRVAPTGVTVNNASSFSGTNGSSTPSGSSITLNNAGTMSAALNLNSGASTTVGSGAYVYLTNANGQFFLTGCEL